MAPSQGHACAPPPPLLRPFAELDRVPQYARMPPPKCLAQATPSRSPRATPERLPATAQKTPPLLRKSQCSRTQLRAADTRAAASLRLRPSPRFQLLAAHAGARTSGPYPWGSPPVDDWSRCNPSWPGWAVTRVQHTFSLGELQNSWLCRSCPRGVPSPACGDGRNTVRYAGQLHSSSIVNRGERQERTTLVVETSLAKPRVGLSRAPGHCRRWRNFTGRGAGSPMIPAT